MAVDPTIPRSRRALLVAGAGAVAATAAQALGAPAPAARTPTDTSGSTVPTAMAWIATEYGS